MDQRLKDSLVLLKEYCATFGLKPTADAEQFKRWEPSYGPIVAGAFCNIPGKEALPPVIFVTPSGDILIEQDEDLVTGNDPVTDIIDPTVIRVSINNKQPIHDATTVW